MSTKKARITIRFEGRLLGAMGVTSCFVERRTVELPSPFTEQDARRAATKALYSAEGDSPAYDSVTVRSVAFN